MDTLDRNRFFSITRRDELPAVIETLEQLLRHDIEVKINAVVMDRRNIEDIIPLVQLTKELPVSVRFIEEMPFNGEGNHYDHLHWHYMRIHRKIEEAFPDIQNCPIRHIPRLIIIISPGTRAILVLSLLTPGPFAERATV